MKIKQINNDSLPGEVVVRYRDFDNNYAIGAQRAARLKSVYDSRQVLTVDLPIVMKASKARQTAEIILNSIWKAKKEFKDIRLPLSYSDLVPTDIIEVTQNGVTYNVRVDSVTISDIVEVTGIQNDTVTYSSDITGETNTQSYQGSSYVGKSEVYLLNLPPLRDQDSDNGYYMAAHGYYSAWGGCSVLMQSATSGFSVVGTIVGDSKVGVCIDALGDGPSSTIDYKNTITVRMRNGVPTSTTKSALLEDITTNTLAVGVDGRWEIIRYITATDNGDGSYTLSGLIRGYQATESAIDQHEIGDLVIFLDPSSLSRVTESDPSTYYIYTSISLGDENARGNDFSFTCTQEAIKPFSPVHVKGKNNFDGTYTITWTRRGRLWGEWRDNVDVPLSEYSESYQVLLYQSDGTTLVSTTEVNSESATIAASPGYKVKVAQKSELYGVGAYSDLATLIGSAGNNYWNPADKGLFITLSGADLVASASSNWYSVRAYYGRSVAKVYFEYTVTAIGTAAFLGIGNSSATLSGYTGSDANGWSYYSGGTKYTNASPASYGSTFTTGDIIGVALDMDSGKIWFSKNGTWQNSGDPAAGTGEAFSGLTGTLYPMVSPSSGGTITVNFGATAFSYTAPTGFGTF